MKTFLAPLALVVSGCALLLACSAGEASSITDPLSTVPQNPVKVTTPSGGLNVTATLVSVALGSDCGNGGGSSPPQGKGSRESSDANVVSGICAAEPDGGPTRCPSPGGGCQQTNMQLRFEASGDGIPAKVEIVTVRLLESKTLAEVSRLDPREPQAWGGGAYAAWDETVTSGDNLNVSYKLSAPDWTRSGTQSSWDYSSNFYLEVTIRIDGVTRTLRSQELSRAPLVAT